MQQSRFNRPIQSQTYTLASAPGVRALRIARRWPNGSTTNGWAIDRDGEGVAEVPTKALALAAVEAARPQRSLFDRLVDVPTSAPYVPHSDTSRAAAADIKPSTGTLRRQVLEHIRAAGERGVTDDEGETALGMRHQTYSARRRELAVSEHIVDSGLRRATSSGRPATVWVAAGEAG